MATIGAIIGRLFNRLADGIFAVMFKAEPFELYSIVNGAVWLDGGSMFGAVPKVLWDKVAEPDTTNRIKLATRTLLAVDRKGGRVVLVDTGCGTKWSPQGIERFGIEFDPTAVPRALSSVGLGVDDVTDVVVTHLHFDHNGGLSTWYDEPGGRTQLCYPQARHWIHRNHWEHANASHPKDRASFLTEDFAWLVDSQQVQWVEGEAPESPFQGFSWFVSHGHTPFQLHPIFGSGRQKLLFIGDLVPTLNHLRLGWVMSFDVAPLTTIDEKARVYRQCLDEKLCLALPHDPTAGGIEIDGTVERPIVSKILAL